MDSHATRLSILALVWLEEHKQSETVKPLIDILLRHPRLSDSDWARVSKIVVAWLRQTNALENSDESLAGLLVRPQLLEAGDLAWTKTQATHWLNNPPNNAQDTHGLRAALDRLRIEE